MTMISTEAPAEVFKELIDEAVARQRLDASEASTAYLVHLLDSFVRSGERFLGTGFDPDGSLSEVVLRASHDRSPESLFALRLVGDLALFLVGFFAEALRCGVVGPKGYVMLGGAAYSMLARSRHAPGDPEMFDELATHFVPFADVLSDVSERCALVDPSDLLRLYERWLRTGSGRSADLLRQQGITVAAGSTAIH